MDRRAFLSGLFGVAGAATLAGLATRTAQAVPLARPPSMPAPDAAQQAEDARTPDGTPIEQAQYYYRRRRRYWRRRYRRRRRLVCRSYRVRGGWVRRCRRVWW
jgi:hypothetical protein